MFSPTKQELAMNRATTQWDEDNPERPLKRGRYKYVYAPVIWNASDNPDEQVAQGQGQVQHGLQHRGLGFTPARKLNTTKSLTILSRASAHTRRTGLSLQVRRKKNMFSTSASAGPRVGSVLYNQTRACHKSCHNSVGQGEPRKTFRERKIQICICPGDI